ncbi:hypothetical protein GB937_004733 [Aspergillus fischeri]|nr:hypothetical protein GB937_004733 [Aspergillus fischeri]
MSYLTTGGGQQHAFMSRPDTLSAPISPCERGGGGGDEEGLIETAGSEKREQGFAASNPQKLQKSRTQMLVP